MNKICGTIVDCGSLIDIESGCVTECWIFWILDASLIDLVYISTGVIMMDPLMIFSHQHHWKINFCRQCAKRCPTSIKIQYENPIYLFCKMSNWVETVVSTTSHQHSLSVVILSCVSAAGEWTCDHHQHQW